MNVIKNQYKKIKTANPRIKIETRANDMPLNSSKISLIILKGVIMPIIIHIAMEIIKYVEVEASNSVTSISSNKVTTYPKGIKMKPKIAERNVTIDRNNIIPNHRFLFIFFRWFHWQVGHEHSLDSIFNISDFELNIA